MFLVTIGAFLLPLVFTITGPVPQEENEKSIAVTNAVTEAAGPSPDSHVIVGKDYSLKQAYKDVFVILAAHNTCSDFFGGPAIATSVLNQFIGKIQQDSLPDSVSFQMSGRPGEFLDLTTGASYRLFNKVMVNSEGSFYQRRFDPMRQRPRNVGRFPPGTRSARALILMHELGHLIRGRNGRWLIPDDGNDSWQSKQNTAQVESVCHEQLKTLN